MNLKLESYVKVLLYKNLTVVKGKDVPCEYLHHLIVAHILRKKLGTPPTKAELELIIKQLFYFNKNEFFTIFNEQILWKNLMLKDTKYGFLNELLICDNGTEISFEDVKNYVRKTEKEAKIGNHTEANKINFSILSDFEKDIYLKPVTRTTEFMERYSSFLISKMVIESDLFLIFTYKNLEISPAEIDSQIETLTRCFQYYSAKYLILSLNKEIEENSSWFIILKMKNKKDLSAIKISIISIAGKDYLNFQKNNLSESRLKNVETLIHSIADALIACKFQRGNLVFQDVSGPNVNSFLELIWYKLYPNNNYSIMKLARIEEFNIDKNLLTMVQRATIIFVKFLQIKRIQEFKNGLIIL